MAPGWMRSTNYVSRGEAAGCLGASTGYDLEQANLFNAKNYNSLAHTVDWAYSTRNILPAPYKLRLTLALDTSL